MSYFVIIKEYANGELKKLGKYDGEWKNEVLFDVVRKHRLYRGQVVGCGSPRQRKRMASQIRRPDMQYKRIRGILLRMVCRKAREDDSNGKGGWR